MYALEDIIGALFSLVILKVKDKEFVMVHYKTFPFSTHTN